ncbi:MAG: hypothetical protein E7193_03800 [Erysipelotrichaceae bacterium]|nr:hypothetical protein [Erysipelotrichaceae bacterium]
MLELIHQYSGIVAIIVYSFILFLILKFRKPEQEEEEETEKEPSFEPERLSPLDLNDEDAVVASLIASIECHNETHKDVRVVSVREVG